MSDKPRSLRFVLLGGVTVVGVVTASVAYSAPEQFFFTGNVNFVNDPSFDIVENSAATALAIFEPALITGGPRDEIPLTAPGQLTISIPRSMTDPVLFDGSDCDPVGACTANIVYENGVFKEINYVNGFNRTPSGIGLASSSTFSLQKDIFGTVFATGGPWLAQASPS